MDIRVDPVRKIPLPFAGDAWAQPDAQVPIPDTDGPLIATGAEVRWRLMPYDGVGPSAQPVDGDASTVDVCIVKAKTDRHGNVSLARTITTVENEGAQVNVGKQHTERDVSPSEEIYLGVVTVTQDTAAALWVFLDAGAVPKP